MTRRWKALLLVALAAAIVYPAVIGMSVGLRRPYHDVADQDMVVMTQAWMINDGQPNSYHEHPGTLTIREAAVWLKITRALGANNIVQLSELPRDGIARELQRLARVGRQLAIANQMLFLVVFAITLWLLTPDLFLVTAGTWLLSASQGVFLETITMRTEPVSMTMTLAAFAAALVAIRHAPRWSVVAAVGAGAFAYVAMVNKVQAGIGLAAFPVLCTVFAKPAMPAWTEPTPRPLAAVGLGFLALVGGVATIYASIHTLAVATEGVSTYHWAFLALCIGCGVSVAVWQRRPWKNVVALSVAAIAGFLAAYFINAPEFNHNDHHSVVYFIEHLRGYCTSDCHETALGSIPALLAKVAGVTFLSKVSVLWGIFQYPFFLVYWAALAAGILCLAGRRWKRALRVFVLLGLAIAIENVFRLRYVDTKSLSYVCYYYVMVEPFVVMAVVVGFGGGEMSRWPVPAKAAVALFVAAVVAMSTSVNLTRYHDNSFNGLGLTQGVTNFCQYIPHTRRVFDLTRQVGICP